MKDLKQNNVEVAAEESKTIYKSNENLDSVGELKIHENVISSIVRKATLKQEGVARLSGNNFVDTIAEIVGSKRIQDRAIIVKFLEDGSLDLEIKIVVIFGFNLPGIASSIQKCVIEEVEKVTGINVCHVNVTVQDVEDEQVTAEEPEDIEVV